jgi:hypothetical protein
MSRLNKMWSSINRWRWYFVATSALLALVALICASTCLRPVGPERCRTLAKQIRYGMTITDVNVVLSRELSVTRLGTQVVDPWPHSDVTLKYKVYLGLGPDELEVAFNAKNRVMYTLIRAAYRPTFREQIDERVVQLRNALGL